MSGSAICARSSQIALSTPTHNVLGYTLARQVLDVLMLPVDDFGQLATIDQLLAHPHLHHTLKHIRTFRRRLANHARYSRAPA